MSKNELLSGKVILVTGGNGLIGRSILRDIRSKGGTAVNADIGEPTAEDINFLHCDITKLDSIQLVIQKVLTQYGRLDGLVNNAYPRTSDWGSDFLMMTEDSLNENVRMQLSSYILFCQQAIKHMISAKSGSIVNIASIYGVVGNDFSIYDGTGINPAAPYAAIKGGLINFSRFLASKYGRDGIRVNVVSPGGVQDQQPEAFIEAYSRKVPMGRMALPDDVSPVVSFLLSDESRYITGHNLLVDGGWTAI